MKITLDETNQAYIIEDLPHELRFYRSPYLTLEELKERVEAICFSVINEKNSTIYEYLLEVLKQGKIQVSFFPQSEIGSFGQWRPYDRTIIIAVEPTDPIVWVDSFLFELCNAGNSCVGLIEKNYFEDEESFALSIEAVEHWTAQKCTFLINEGISKYGWPENNRNRKRCKRIMADFNIESLRIVLEPALEHDGHSHYDQYVSQFIIAWIEALTNNLNVVEKEKRKVFEEKIQALKEKMKKLENEAIVAKKHLLSVYGSLDNELTVRGKRDETRECLIDSLSFKLANIIFQYADPYLPENCRVPIEVLYGSYDVEALWLKYEGMKINTSAPITPYYAVHSADATAAAVASTGEKARVSLG